MLAGWGCPYCKKVRQMGDGGCCRALEDVVRLKGALAHASVEANRARLDAEQIVEDLRGNGRGLKAAARGAAGGLAHRLHEMARLWGDQARKGYAEPIPPAESAG